MRLLQDRIKTAQRLARENLEHAQGKQKERYDRGTRARTFNPGDQVLVARRILATTKGDPWQGPFPVVRVLGPLSYEVRCGRRATRLKRLHVNDLKEWHPRPNPTVCALSVPPEDLPEGPRVERSPHSEADRPGIDPGLTAQQRSEVLAILDSCPPSVLQDPGANTPGRAPHPDSRRKGSTEPMEAPTPGSVGPRGQRDPRYAGVGRDRGLSERMAKPASVGPEA